MISNSPADHAPNAGRGPLVVGGRGFVGAHVVRALIAAGRRPHLFGPPMIGEQDRLAGLAGAFDETRGSIEDRAALAAALAACAAREIVSTAAFSDARDGLMRAGERDRARALAVNVAGLNTLIEAAADAGVRRLVWTSSTTVYGPASRYPRTPVDEDAPPHPQTFYGLTKTLAERLACYHRERGSPETVALRLPLVLGRGLWYQGAAATLYGLLVAAAPGSVHRARFPDTPLDLMDARDAAGAILAALAAPARLRPVYNVNGFTATAADLARAAERAVPGYRVELKTSTPHTAPFPLIDDARARVELDWLPEHDLAALVAQLTAQPDHPGEPS